jgi:hypothetical protein
VTLSLVFDMDIPFDPNSFARIKTPVFVCIAFPQRASRSMSSYALERVSSTIRGGADWKRSSASTAVAGDDDSYGAVSDDRTTPRTFSV